MFRNALKTIVQSKSSHQTLPWARCFSVAVEKAPFKPSIEDIKKLRTASQAPMNDCKKALVEAEGDFPSAFEWLRKKGMATAVAKAGRTTSEGLVGAAIKGNMGALVELNSETDFVSRNELFQNFLNKLSDAAISSQSQDNGEINVDNLLASNFEGLDGTTIPLSVGVNELIGKVGENISVRRAQKIQVDEGMICSYIHNVASAGMGRSGALVALKFPAKTTDSSITKDIERLGHRLAMHIVASKPQYLCRNTVPKEKVDREKNFLLEQTKTSGKPQNILKKMVEGRMGKFYADVCLLEQGHMLEEGNPKVQKVVDTTSKALGVKIEVGGFIRYQVGEETTV